MNLYVYGVTDFVIRTVLNRAIDTNTLSAVSWFPVRTKVTKHAKRMMRWATKKRARLQAFNQHARLIECTSSLCETDEER